MPLSPSQTPISFARIHFGGIVFGVGNSQATHGHGGRNDSFHNGSKFQNR